MIISVLLLLIIILTHLPCSFQLALVQVDVSVEQVVCGGQGDSDHPLAPSHGGVALQEWVAH